MERVKITRIHVERKELYLKTQDSNTNKFNKDKKLGTDKSLKFLSFHHSA